jgi:hypothetical protein
MLHKWIPELNTGQSITPIVESLFQTTSLELFHTPEQRCFLYDILSYYSASASSSARVSYAKRSCLSVTKTEVLTVVEKSVGLTTERKGKQCPHLRMAPSLVCYFYPWFASLKLCRIPFIRSTVASAVEAAKLQSNPAPSRFRD